MALVFYARVSSKGQNLDRQLARANEVKADKIFTDKQSGKDLNRPDLERMFEYIREGDIVEVVSLDRLSRDYNDIQHLVQRLKDKKIKLIVDDKSHYTDWSVRDDIKANLQVDLILLLDEFDYPPVTIDDVYKEVLEQAENFKKYSK